MFNAICKKMAQISLVCACFIATVPIAGAQCTFTSGSNVFALDPKTYYIGVEATVPANGLGEQCTFTFPNPLPSSGTVVSVQGTVTFRSSCLADALDAIQVNGNTKYYPNSIKISATGGAETLFVSYNVPLSFTNSGASIKLQSSVAAGCSAAGDWEFQGVLQLQ